MIRVELYVLYPKEMTSKTGKAPVVRLDQNGPSLAKLGPKKRATRNTESSAKVFSSALRSSLSRRKVLSKTSVVDDDVVVVVDDDDDVCEDLLVSTESHVFSTSPASTEKFEVVRVRCENAHANADDDDDDDDDDEKLRRKQKNQRKNVHVFMVPGNPGVAQYYEEFAREIAAEIVRMNISRVRRVEIECIGFVGHYVDERLSSNAKEWFTLEEQKKNVLEYVRKRVEENDEREESVSIERTEHYLVGHSIGAHVAIHCLHVMDEADTTIRKCVGLMPFLHVNERSKTQRRLAFLVSLKFLVRVVAKILHVLRNTKFLQNFFTKGMEKGSQGYVTTLKWAREQSFINMAFMGDTEFKFLKDWKRDVDDVIRKSGKKISLLYANDDHWAPLWQKEKLADQMGITIVHDESENYKHAFVLDRESSRRLAIQCAKLLIVD